MSSLTYPVVVTRLSEEDGGGYAAFVPDLYGCQSDGETPEEAFANVQDAIVQWCAEMRDLGREIPEPGWSRRVGLEHIASLEALVEKQDQMLRKAVPEIKAEIEALKSRVERSLAVAGDDSQLAWRMFGETKSLPRGAKRPLHKSAH